MNTTTAHQYARLMVEREKENAGTVDRALDYLQQRYKISRWQLSHLRKGNAKTIRTSLWVKLEGAFIDHCRAQAARLLHEAEMAQATGSSNDDLAAIESEIAALALRLETAKSKKTR